MRKPALAFNISIGTCFNRDHPDCADKATVEAFADAILALDDSMPNGTYIDMCSKLPVLTVLNGISHASFQQKNYLMVYQILHAHFTQPAPAYTSNAH